MIVFDTIKIDLKDIGLPRQCLEMVARIYNHPNTNNHTKDYIRFELQSMLGRDYDIKGFLDDPQFKIKNK
ncbi:hypothetical protein BHU72_11975 [Desulfuribacillus stibiiarsenatis]|uniref:Uncharacterized protein n=1 Tax=Desulfuribacillus stibiiarsenatis TaxID=1390249 RepID=A0A1E5L7X3_9FIRM|nr:hypothetical protein [Desulfuribacillus stibiiarsenatis]OEH86245.1 hypothetical protein BHU72_11975 [Desulfuribacillus stibiiarsenatis]